MSIQEASMRSISPKAIISCRVSSKEQEDSGYSLAAQEKLLTEYAEGKFTVTKAYKIAESASGKQVRKIFNEMMRHADKSGVTVILCEKIDRLTRNPKDAAMVDDWVKANPKREVHFVKENFILNQNTKAHENLVWNMKVAIARFYTDNLSEEVRKGQKEKIAQGWLPTQPPLGYKTIGEKGRKTIIPDETSAPLVKQMFELYASGNYSLGRLHSEMVEVGLHSRSGKLSMSRLHQLLSDPFYYGKLRWKGELYEGKHEPLIHKDLFSKVQNRLGRRGENPTFSKRFGLFKAKIHCEKCGGLVTWYMKKGHWYGHCNNNQKSKGCVGKTCLREDRVEAELLPLFDALAPKSDEILDWIKDILLDAHGETKTIREIEANNINAQLGLIRTRKDRLYEDKLDGAIALDFYTRKFSEYTQQEEELEDRLAKLHDSNNERIQIGIVLHELAFHLRRIYEAAEDKTDEDAEIKDLKRLAYSQIFADLIQDRDQIKPVYTPAGEYLMNWMPKLNDYYEQTQNLPNREDLLGLLSSSSEIPQISPSKTEKKLRTTKSLTTTPSITDPSFNSLAMLRDLDSNQEPCR